MPSILVLVLLAAAPAVAPPPVNLAGTVVRRGDRKPVVGATVDAGGLTAITDADGRFALAGVPAGAIKVVVSSEEIERYETEEHIAPDKRTEVTYHVMPAPGAFSAVVVGKREKKEVSEVALRPQEIDNVPGTYGDAVKVVQNLPGVSRTPFGSNDLVLRGGDPHDTRVYVDGLWVPNVFHFGGLASVYSSELLDEVRLEPGGFGVERGRATGGVIELKTRDPSFKRLHLVADADLLDATAVVEGPLTEDLAAAVAFRRSYADLVLNAVGQSNGAQYTVAPRYYDLQGKLVWKAGAHDTLRLDVFGSDDRLAVVGAKSPDLVAAGTIDSRSGFLRGSLSWEHRFSAGTRSEIRAGLGRLTSYRLFGNIQSDELYVPVDLQAKIDGQVSSAVRLAAGLDMTAIDARARLAIPMPVPPDQLPPPVLDAGMLRTTITTWLYEPAAWVEATLKPIPSLALVPGVRVDHESLMNRTWVDPRLGARWTASSATVLKASLGLYHQSPIVQYETRELGNPAIGPEGAVQASVGIEQRIAGPVSLDFQVYENRLFDRVVPTNATTVRDGQIVDERYVNAGTGHTYGAEVLLRWMDDGRQLGWISYSFTRSIRDAAAVGGGVETSGDQLTQPHSLTAVYSVQLPEVWRGLRLGTRIRYTSGLPYRAVTSSVYDADADAYQAIPAGTVGQRLPDFFQTDLRLEKRWTFDAWTLDTYLDVQNVTNRVNAELTTYDYRYAKSAFIGGLPLLPSLGLRAEY